MFFVLNKVISKEKFPGDRNEGNSKQISKMNSQ